MHDQPDLTLLAKWVAGRLEPDDERALADWLAADPAHAAQLDELRELWRLAAEVAQTRSRAADPGEEQRWAGVLRAIRVAEPATSGAAPPRLAPAPTIEFPFVRRRVPTWAWLGAAAAVIVLAVGGGRRLGADRSQRDIAHTPPAMRFYATARGERAEFRLRDGTRVMLSVASRLRVPLDFGERSRTVHLEGGAYFDVVHDPARSFVVHANDLIAQDLGTEFVVRAYPEDQHARVVVRSGQVELRSAQAADTSSSEILSPGESGSLDAEGRLLVQPADTAAEFAWTGGTLVLDGTPLREALVPLGRWFDLDFHLSDTSIGRIRVAATLTNQPTDAALSFLAASLGLRAVRRGQVVTFYPVRAP